jgi:hypothetical protein
MGRSCPSLFLEHDEINTPGGMEWRSPRRQNQMHFPVPLQLCVNSLSVKPQKTEGKKSRFKRWR